MQCEVVTHEESENILNANVSIKNRKSHYRNVTGALDVVYIGWFSQQKNENIFQLIFKSK